MEPHPHANEGVRRYLPSFAPLRFPAACLFRVARLRISFRSRFLHVPIGFSPLSTAAAQRPWIVAPDLQASAAKALSHWRPPPTARVPPEKESTKIAVVVYSSSSFTSRSSLDHQRSACSGLVQICVLNEKC